MSSSIPLIYFIRHGQTDWNAAKRLQGESDIPLNALGRAQALRNGGVLAELIENAGDFDFVCSPLLRARETMDIICGVMALPFHSYKMDDRLKEMRFGAWSGMTIDEVAEKDPEHYARRQADRWNVPPPDGESYGDLLARLLLWLPSVTRPTVVVSHGGVSRCLRAHFLQLPHQEAVRLDLPQDKVMKIEGGGVKWF